MIIFDLECLNGHTFEGWFEDRQDLERQREDGILICPVCETASVVQKISPVSIRTSCSAEKNIPSSIDAIEELAHKVSEYVENNYEDVGSGFTKEALKMHYGVTEYRNIRGTATEKEDKILSEEEVPVLKIPVFKKSKKCLN